jgi:hypothetical protein
LLRALFALQVQQKSSKDEVEPLMSYVLFSACLLFDIACVIENRTVAISGQGGSFIRIWDPFHEGSLPIAGYYRIRRAGGITPWSCRRSAVSLAGKLMPQEGFHWIFENPHAFNIWIALLSEDKEGGGVLSLYIDRAREMLEEFKTTVEYFVQTNIDEFESKDTKDGDLFLEWYLQELEKGKMQLFQVADDKILITQDAINRYASITKGASEKKVLEGLQRLGFTSGELETFYSTMRQRAIQSAAAKQGLGASSSLFGAGKEGQLPAERAAERVEAGRIFKPEDQLGMGGGKPDSLGGVLYGIVVNVANGLSLPATAFNSSVTVVSPQQQALANQLPDLNVGNAAQQTNIPVATK